MQSTDHFWTSVMWGFVFLGFYRMQQMWQGASSETKQSAAKHAVGLFRRLFK